MLGARALDICEVVEMLLGVPRDNGMFAIYCNHFFVSGALDVLTLGEQKGFQHVFPTTASSNWLSRSKMD